LAGKARGDYRPGLIGSELQRLASGGIQGKVVAPDLQLMPGLIRLWRRCFKRLEAHWGQFTGPLIVAMAAERRSRLEW